MSSHEKFSSNERVRVEKYQQWAANISNERIEAGLTALVMVKGGAELGEIIECYRTYRNADDTELSTVLYDLCLDAIHGFVELAGNHVEIDIHDASENATQRYVVLDEFLLWSQLHNMIYAEYAIGEQLQYMKFTQDPKETFQHLYVEFIADKNELMNV